MNLPPVLKSIKRGALRTARGLGMFQLLTRSGWRRRRLLILCYHSLSRRDEHLWKPQLFMQPALFQQRMESLRRSGANVLPLADAVRLLYAQELPERSVAITFDDGTADFHDLVYPFLRGHGFPATVYMTTYYSEHPYPLFRLICEYLLWKQRDQLLSLREVTGQDTVRELADEEMRLKLVDELHEHARRENMSAADRNQLAERLAVALGIDYDELRESRILQLMRPAEVARLASEGVDFQLHTHRHRSPPDEGLYRREISENRAALRAMTDRPARHFCYPSGRYRAEFLPWLREEGVLSATTCKPGLASPASDPLLLPRVVDVGNLSNLEFEAWVAGAGAWFPRRPTGGAGTSPRSKPQS